MVGRNHIEILFENKDESKLFREAIRWNDKYTLKSIVCELKGYSIPDGETKNKISRCE